MMGKDTGISWCDSTFNPWWGCSKVSPGCQSCYAETLSHRFGNDIWGPGKPRKVMSDHYWKQPLLWQKEAEKAVERRRVFCASMSDVFDAEAPAGQLARLWGLIRETTYLDWLLLTKRPERISGSLPSDWGSEGYHNVWLGTSVETQKYADERIPHLLSVPAVNHFLSVEPMLAPVRLFDYVSSYSSVTPRKVSWVICGGESGRTGIRPMKPEWVRALRDECVKDNVAFFFKQWGHIENNPNPHDPTQDASKGGHLLDGETWHQFPQRRKLFA